MTPEHARNDAADMAGREDDRCFQEVVDDIKPHLSERETLMLELIEMLYCRANTDHARDQATEQMREIANVHPCFFYADGVWLVRSDQKDKMRILKIGELPELYPFASMAMSEGELTKVIAQAQSEPHSAASLALAVLRWMASTQPVSAR